MAGSRGCFGKRTQLLSDPFSSSPFSCFPAVLRGPDHCFGEQVRCLEDMGLERDLFVWYNRNLTDLFQSTDWCFSLGVSLSFPVVQSANSI